MTGASRLIDITLPFSERLPVWPGDAPVRIERSTGTVTVSELCMSSHVGTHLDAPAHFFPQAPTVDHLRLETLIGPAFVADAGLARVITAEVLEQSGIPAGAERVLLRTVNSAGAIAPGGEGPDFALQHSNLQHRPFDTNYAALDASAGRWLLSRHIQLIGVDGPSVDLYSGDFEVHRLLLANQIIIVENLSLQDVAPGSYRLICLPLRYEGGDGAPVRAVLETM